MNDNASDNNLDAFSRIPGFVDLIVDARASGAYLDFVIDSIFSKSSENETLAAWTFIHLWTLVGGPSSGIVMPTWVMAYLSTVASKVQSLRSDIEQSIDHSIGLTINEISGFTINGKSVFLLDTLRKKEIFSYVIYSNHGSEGVTGDARIAFVREFLGVSDTRTARRYVAKGSTRTKKSPPMG